MRFFQVRSPSEARQLLDRELPLLPTETVPLAEARARVAAREIAAPHDLPEFDRSVVDGFAVRAADTFGASAGLPSALELLGEVRMGESATEPVRAGGCFRIATGGMLPPDGDAVVMVEHADGVDETLIEV